MAQISTEQAVEQLHQMFGDYEKASLAAALEAHGGHVERTVEHLLSNPSAAATTTAGGSTSRGNVQPSTDHDAALALQLSREWSDDPTLMPPPPTRPVGIPSPYDPPIAPRGAGESGGGAVLGAGSGRSQVFSSSTTGGGSSNRRGRRVALPEEFLRVPGWNGGSSSSDPQVAADARLAMILQNESFQRELQSHPELAHLGARGSSGWGTRSREKASSGPSIREQLAGLGNDMRRKVEELAVRWKMKDPGTSQDSTGYSSVPLMSSQGDDEDQAEVVHFAQDSTTRRSYPASNLPASGSAYRDDPGDERLADARRSKKDR